jgi:thiamine-monophosphate kinase
VNTEAQLIKRIARAIPSRAVGGKGLRLGIGDDAAIVAARWGYDWVVSCDAVLEGVHFIPGVHPADSIGYKALVRAASDLAAMGATPRVFLMTLAMPAARTGKWLDEFLRGMGRAARLLGMVLAGGDTSRNREISISMTVMGEARRGASVKRGGARRGDLIYVSGKLGRAQLGLELVMGGLGNERRFAGLVRAHLYPRVRVELGKWLAERGIASAMMDLSDGLSTDLRRMAEASGAGARVWSERIPCVTIPPGVAKRLGGRRADPLKMALHGGEDYELLFTVRPRMVKMLRGAVGFGQITPIGEITRGKGILIIDGDGKAKALAPLGWDSFRKG